MSYIDKEKQKEFQRKWTRDRMSDLVAKRRARIKRYKIAAVNLLGGKCERCGYNKCVDALEFHHKKGFSKEDTVAKLLSKRGWAVIEKEVYKCELLCANCHAEEHYIPNQNSIT